MFGLRVAQAVYQSNSDMVSPRTEEMRAFEFALIVLDSDLLFGRERFLYSSVLKVSILDEKAHRGLERVKSNLRETMGHFPPVITHPTPANVTIVNALKTAALGPHHVNHTLLCLTSLVYLWMLTISSWKVGSSRAKG